MNGQTATSGTKMPETSLNVTNSIVSNSAYVRGNSDNPQAFSTQPLTPNILHPTNFEQFYQLPIPITVNITNNGVAQPTLHLTDDGIGSVTSGGTESYTLSLDHFAGQALDRNIIVKMQIALSPGAAESSIVLKNDNGQTIPITWVQNPGSTVGKFSVTINNQTGKIAPNTSPSAPASAPTADFFFDPKTTIAEDDTFRVVGYQTQIPGKNATTPPGQSMINPATSDVTTHVIGINAATQVALFSQYIASAFSVGDAIQSTPLLSDVHATPTTLLTTPGHA
jgi:hypothetical protein